MRVAQRLQETQVEIRSPKAEPNPKPEIREQCTMRQFGFRVSDMGELYDRLQLDQKGSRPELPLIYHAVLHDKAHLAHGFNMLCGIACNGNQIGEKIDAYAAQLAFHPNDLRLPSGGGHQPVAGSHAAAHHPLQFSIVRPMCENTNIAPQADRDAALEG